MQNDGSLELSPEKLVYEQVTQDTPILDVDSYSDIQTKHQLTNEQVGNSTEIKTPEINLVIDKEQLKQIKDLSKIDFKLAPKERKLSPLLSKEEKNLAWNLGQSMDSKKVTSALGYLDLKQICYCLAKALNKHIQFSQGFFFLGDLKALALQKDNQVGDNLEFSYNLGTGLKIDV